MFMQSTHQIQVLTEPLCRAQATFYALPNNEPGTIYCGLTYSAKQTVRESVGLPKARGKLVCELNFHKRGGGGALAVCKNSYNDRAKRPPVLLKSSYLSLLMTSMPQISSQETNTLSNGCNKM